MKYDDVIDTIVALKDRGQSNRNIALTVFGRKSKESTVRYFYNKWLEEELKSNGGTDFKEDKQPSFYMIEDEDEDSNTQKELSDDDKLYILSLEKQVQRLQDINTNLRREKRENYRDVNALEAIYEGFVTELKKHTFSPKSRSYNPSKDNQDTKTLYGVIQLSDLHFGERVEYEGETYFDMSVAAARLKKFADKCIGRFLANGIDKVTIALTGDLINSDRRLDEVTANSNSRARTALNAVDLLYQFIDYVGEHFDITVASVIGNESRLNKDVGWVDFTGSDNFDYIIHEILERLFDEYEHINFVPMDDVFECLLDIGGFNLLLTHGNNRLAGANPEPEVQKLKGRYSDYGQRVDYVIFGHIHATLITDSFARSASIVGGNGYSAKALNLSSTASQNYYIIDTDDMSISGCNVNLNKYNPDDTFVMPDSASRIKQRLERKNIVPYKV